MDQYCVVVCGLRAGASDEASAWAPVAAALRMEQEEFARRMLAALPRIVRRQLDQAAAERIAQLLQGMHVDARALPDDAQLAYIERAGRGCGPLPRSALEMFIEPGEPYRLQGSQAWETWPQPPEHEQVTAPAPAMDEAEVAPVDAPPVEALADLIEDEAPAPAAETRSPVAPPPLPTEPAPPEAPAATPDDALTGDDALTADDALINPPEDDPAAAEEPAVPAAEAETAPPRRAWSGRLLLLLVLVGAAAWAYQHWMADTPVAATAPPAPAAHAPQPAAAATSAPAPATSVEAAPAAAASTDAAGASSTPAPAASTPAPAGTAALPAAASTTTAPAAASSAAAATASSTAPAAAASVPPAPAGSAAAPAAAGSSARG